MSIFTIFFQGVGELYKRCKPTTNEPIKREHELYRQFIQLLMTHYTQEHEVSFYAKKCGVTPAHFSGAIRKASGHYHGNYYHECQGTIEVNPIACKGNCFFIRI